jgi:cell division protein FtsI/penicillin-binding protein 2
LSEKTKKEIERLSLNGLGFEMGDKRFYPEASLAAQLLGFVGYDENGQKKGYFGLEGYYDQELKGKPGKRFFEQDALGRPIPLSEEIEERAISGRDLYLNIDRTLQFLSEKHLAEGIKKTGASSGWVAILDPGSGAVLTMAAYPSFNPGEYYLTETDNFRNPLVSLVFEPGSIFKVITMASAIDTGAVSLGEICPKCAGPRTIGEYTIKTWNEKYYPNSSMTEIIVHSDNVGMVYVMEKLGRDRFLDYLGRFGFGQRTGIDLQGEMESPVKEKGQWREIDLATASFGQGIAATPIQILSAIAVIANGGELYQPQVVGKISDITRQINIEPVKKRRVISRETSEAVTAMMIEMVEQNNTQKLKPPGYRIAGKSGTAQIPVKGSYTTDRTITSFIGFAPVDSPRFVMLVTLKEPKNSMWAEATAAPIWFKIAEEIFRLWKIKPDNF